MVEGGLDEPPSFIDLVCKTHTRKDGSFIDERAEALVLAVEEAVDSMILDEDSPNGASPTASTATTAPSRRFLLDQEFLKVPLKLLFLISLLEWFTTCYTQNLESSLFGSSCLLLVYVLLLDFYLSTMSLSMSFIIIVSILCSPGVSFVNHFFHFFSLLRQAKGVYMGLVVSSSETMNHLSQSQHLLNAA